METASHSHSHRTNLLSIGLAVLRVEERVGVEANEAVGVGGLSRAGRAHAEAVHGGGGGGGGRRRPRFSRAAASHRGANLRTDALGVTFGL